MHVRRIERGKLKFRLGTSDDVAPLLDKYARQYFDEAGFGEFAEFDIERAKIVMAQEVKSGFSPFILAVLDDEIVGMISYTLSHVFTARPIAILWMIYVMPPYRRSAIGRMLVWLAVDAARGDGACAFFASIPPTSSTARSLCNLFRHSGFAPMGGAFMRGI